MNAYVCSVILLDKLVAPWHISLRDLLFHSVQLNRAAKGLLDLGQLTNS
jgi:hypothetical protein